MFWKWLLAATFAAAQPPPELTTQIQQFRYPPLARSAAVQGIVTLSRSAIGVTLLRGHPLLSPAASKSTESFPPIPGHDTITVTWHFDLVATPTQYIPEPITVPINNKFERALRRLLHRKTDKVVLPSVCEQPPRLPNKLTITGPHIEIWIAATHACLQTQTASAPTKNKT